MSELEAIQKEVLALLQDLHEAFPMSSQHLLVIGCSTSEVIGEKIGTHGTEEVAGAILQAVQSFQQQTGVQLAFQCCEHLNRALVVEKQTAEEKGFERVSVVPKRHAGGAMATMAYKNLHDPVVVEWIQADCGIDIGDTLIGMHLKHVAVPIRSSIKKVGEAHVTLAKTRPKLIGGVRACYE